jgi:hypothetical protein
MKRYYAVKAVQNAKQQWVPKTRLVLTDGVDYDSDNGESIQYLPPLQDPETGALLGNFYFVVADLKSHAKLLTDPDHTPLPDFPPDGKWASITLALRTALKAKLKAAMNFSDAEVQAIDGKDGYREVLDAVLAKLQPVTLDTLEANLTR